MKHGRGDSYVIEVEHLGKVYRRRGGEPLWAVDDVSFQVREGEVFGCLGPNGAGKTTTINVLCTLTRPTRGRAALNGHDVVREPDAVRRSIGVVFQDPSLDDRLTARENLEFHGLLYGVPRATRRERIDLILEMVDLRSRQHDLVRTFSGGMKRRLEIGRGLLHYPRVLFLDEPTLGLDPQTRARIWEYLRALRREEEITIFLTTHYLDEAEHCDRIAIIDRGRLVALDTPENLKRGLGGDHLVLETPKPDALASWIALRFKQTPKVEGRHVSLEVPHGDKVLPVLVREAPVEIESARLRSPSLDDVFLGLTGRDIREESADSTDRMRAAARRKRRR